MKETKSKKEKAGAEGPFLVCGTDEFEVSRSAKALADSLCPPENRAFGLEIIDGACDTIDEALGAVRKCLEALRTVGFFGADKVVWFKDVAFLYENRTGRNAEVKEAIGQLAQEIKDGLLPGLKFLVSASTVDKRTAFYKAIQKAGEVRFFDMPEKSYKWDEHAREAVVNFLGEAGLKARHDVVAMLVDRAGPETRQLHQEIEKLSIYLGDRKEVAMDDVLDIVSPARERGYGELTDAFGKRDLAGALRVARQLMDQKENAVGLIIGLENRVRDLLVYRMALDQRWLRVTGSPDWPKAEWSSSPEAESFFSAMPNDPRRGNPYWGGMMARQANSFSTLELQRIQRTLVEEHGRMTEGQAPAEALLEWAIIGALGKTE